MKHFSYLFLICSSLSSFSQTAEIIRILNRELEIEIKNQSGVIPVVDKNGDVIEYTKKASVIKIVEPFEIKGQKLTLTLKHPFFDGGGYQIERQEVQLKDIVSVGKDIQVIFDTKDATVEVTRTNYYDDGRIEAQTLKQHHLATYLSFEKQNEHLADELIAAFKKAGFDIQKNSWFD